MAVGVLMVVFYILSMLLVTSLTTGDGPVTLPPPLTGLLIIFAPATLALALAGMVVLCVGAIVWEAVSGIGSQR
jgi:hypothetical protein